MGEIEEEGFDQRNKVEFFLFEYSDSVESGEEVVLCHPLHHAEQGRRNAEALDDEVSKVFSWTQHKEDVQACGIGIRSLLTSRIT